MALSTISANTTITASALNTVIDAVNSIQTNSSQVYITETWNNGKSWYRKWSDGWIEQGGFRGTGIVTLHVPFTTTNYNINLTADSTSSGLCIISEHFLSKNTTTFSMRAQQWDSGHSYSGISWRAYGY
mgnify:CR=1 FL=1